MACNCEAANELYGSDAESYVRDHLRRLDERGPGELEERYVCPDTGKRWLLDFPDRTEREPGQARLRAETLTA